MGKRSNFERAPRDFYPTPYEAVKPLLPHLDACTHFDEPCAGDGRLIRHLEDNGHHCIRASDIHPYPHVNIGDATKPLPFSGATFYITNPPWDRKVLHAIIENLSRLLPTWLLFDADWMHTKQSIPYMKYCRKIVSVGRVKWIPGSPSVGKDNCCWYLFDQNVAFPRSTEFIGRTE